MRESMFTGEGITYPDLTQSDGELSRHGKLVKLNVLTLIEEKISSNTFFFSVELIPGTNTHLDNQLKESFQYLAQCQPLFATVTWNSMHLKFTKDESSDHIIKVHHPAFDLVAILQKTLRIPAVMHLSAGSLCKAEVYAILVAAQAVGIRNILALRGDIDPDSDARDFQFASNLVEFIRKEFGDTFTIAVAGYPLGHPQATTYKDDVLHLKDKIDCGADFIMTQVIFSFEEFNNFVLLCRQLEINVPIVPGLFLFETKNSLLKMIELCKIPPPHKILKKIEDIRDKELIEGSIGFVEVGNVLKLLKQSVFCPGVHFFTLNRAAAILKLYSSIALPQQKLKAVNGNDGESI